MLKEAILIGAQITSNGGIIALPKSFSEQLSIPGSSTTKSDLNSSYISLNGVNITFPNLNFKTVDFSQEKLPSPETSLSPEEQKIIETGILFYKNYGIEITNEIKANELAFLDSLPTPMKSIDSMTIEELYDKTVERVSLVADRMPLSNNPLFLDANSVLYENLENIQVDPTLDSNVDLLTDIAIDENNKIIYSLSSNPQYVLAEDSLSIALKITGSAVTIRTVKEYIDQYGFENIGDLDLKQLQAFIIFQQTVAFIAEAGIIGPEIFNHVSNGINNPIAQDTLKYLELEERGLDWLSQEWIDYANTIS